MTRTGARLLGFAMVLLGAVVAFAPPPARATHAAMTGTAANPSNLAANQTLTGPTGLTATGRRLSVTLTWAAAAPSNGNGNGYAITGVNNGLSAACPAAAASYTTWVGSTVSATLTFTDTGSLASGIPGTYVCYLVQTGYSSGGPPWASRPQWTNQGSLATVAFLLAPAASVQTGAEATGTTSVAPSLGAGSTAGNLLVATVVSPDATTAFTGPAGWTLAARASLAGTGAGEIWYRAGAPAGTTTATWSDAAATAIEAQMSEFSGVSALDVTGTVTAAAASLTATAATASATATPGELAVTVFQGAGGSNPSFISGAGWTNMVTDRGNRYVGDYQFQAAAGAESETMTSSKTVTWAGVIAAFK